MDRNTKKGIVYAQNYILGEFEDSEGDFIDSVNPATGEASFIYIFFITFVEGNTCFLEMTIYVGMGPHSRQRGGGGEQGGLRSSAGVQAVGRHGIRKV